MRYIIRQTPSELKNEKETDIQVYWVEYEVGYTWSGIKNKIYVKSNFFKVKHTKSVKIQN